MKRLVCVFVIISVVFSFVFVTACKKSPSEPQHDDTVISGSETEIEKKIAQFIEENRDIIEPFEKETAEDKTLISSRIFAENNALVYEETRNVTDEQVEGYKWIMSLVGESTERPKSVDDFLRLLVDYTGDDSVQYIMRLITPNGTLIYEKAYTLE